MTRTSSEPVLIAVGSNVGDRLGWLRMARRRIAALPDTTSTAASAVYETEAVGGPPQGRYLNACIAVETRLTPLVLLGDLLAIEHEAGRVRTGPDEPRTLDLDLLLFGRHEMAGDRLVLPHPRFVRRASRSFRRGRRGRMGGPSGRRDRGRARGARASGRRRALLR